MMRNRFVNGKNPYENDFYGWSTTTGSSDEFIFGDGIPVIATKVSDGNIHQYVDLTDIEKVYAEVTNLPGVFGTMVIRLGVLIGTVPVQGYKFYAITVPEDQRIENRFCSFGTAHASHVYGIRNITTETKIAREIYRTSVAAEGVNWKLDCNVDDVSYRIQKVILD